MKSRVLYIVLLLSLPAFATISQVQSIAKWTCGASGQTVTCVVTTNTAVSSGHMLAVWTFWESSNGSGGTYPYTASVGDTAGPPSANSFYSAVGPTLQLAASTPTTAQLFYAKNINASTLGDVITVTYICPWNPTTGVGNPACTTTPSIALAGVVVVEYSGADQSYPLDSISAGYSTALNPTGLLDSGTVAPANPNLLVFAGGIIDNGALAAGSGFTGIQAGSLSSGSAITEQNASAISGNNVLQRATACITGGSVCSTTSTGNWVMQMAVFRDASWSITGGWTPVRPGNALNADQFPNLQAAVTYLGTASGTIRMPVGYRQTLTGSGLTLGSSTQAVHLVGEGDVVITCSNSSGWCLQLSQSSTMSCTTNGIGGGGSGGSCVIAQSGASGSGILTNAAHDSGGSNTQSYFTVSGWTIRADATGSTNSVAAVELNGLAGFAGMQNILLYNFPSIGLKIDSSQVVFCDNCEISGTGSSNSQPLLISGGATGGTEVETVIFKGGSIQFPGPMQYVADINGNNHVGNTNVVFLGAHFEQANNSPTAPAIRVVDFVGVHFSGIFCNVFTNPSNPYSCISLPASSITDDVTVDNLVMGNGTVAINNANYPSAYATVGPQVAHYAYQKSGGLSFLNITS